MNTIRVGDRLSVATVDPSLPSLQFVVQAIVRGHRIMGRLESQDSQVRVLEHVQSVVIADVRYLHGVPIVRMDDIF